MPQRVRQSREVPIDALRLAAERIKARLVEIRGDELRVVCGQEAIGPVVETLARDVHVVRVEHPMNEPRDHPAGAHHRATAGHFANEGHCTRHRIRRIDPGVVLRDAMAQQLLDARCVRKMRQALKRAEAKMRMTQPNQDRCARGRWFIVSCQPLTGLEQAERLRRGNAEGFEHLRRQHLADAALERQSTVTTARPTRRAAPLRSEVE